MPMTMVEKILARATGQSSVKAGDVHEPRVDLAMSHENAALVLNQFPLGTLDEDRPDHTPQILVHDVNRDGLNDIITSSAHKYGIFWYQQVRGDGEPAWRKHVIDSSWSQAHSLTLADLDADGDLDLVTGKRFMAHNGSDPDESGKLGVYWYELQRGDIPRWTKHVISFDQAIGSGVNLCAVDLDKDGDVDVVYSNGDAFDYAPPTGRGWNGLQWLENRGGLTFRYHRIGDFAGASSPQAVDMDGDGDMDVALVSAYNNWDRPEALSLAWFENDGAMSFTLRPVTGTPTHLITLAVGDLDRNGKPDLVTGGMHMSYPFDRMSRVTVWMQR